MDSKGYIQAALRTEAPITREVEVRAIRASGDILCRLEADVKMASTIDSIKKHLFYGATLATSPFFIKPSVLESLVDPKVLRLLHAALGLRTEAAELTRAILDHVVGGKPLDTVNLVEECGDLLWYMAILADALGVDFEDMQRRNIRKLRARYPEKFTEESATVRDLEKEREVLEVDSADD